MTTPVPNAAIVHAWADGVVVQWRGQNVWHDQPVDDPPDTSLKNIEWRIKPEEKRYRVALMEDEDLWTVGNEDDAATVKAHPMFIKWLCDWTPYDDSPAPQQEPANEADRERQRRAQAPGRRSHMLGGLQAHRAAQGER